MGKKRRWFKKGFSLIDEIRNRQRVFIEIGGPTPKGFELINFSDFLKRVFVSNITRGNPIYNSETAELLGYGNEEKIDFLTDGRRMPFRDGSISVCFISCLPVKIRKDVLEDVVRVLEDGGLVVWQGGIRKNKKFAEKLGLKIVAYTSLYSREDRKYFHRNVVFQKG